MQSPDEKTQFLAEVRGVPAYKVAQVLTQHAHGEISFLGCSKNSMAEAFSQRFALHGGYTSLAGLTLQQLKDALGGAHKH